MNSDFLKAANRGRSQFKHYALAFLLLVVGSIGFIFFLSIILAIYTLASGISIEEFRVENLTCTSQLLAASGVYALISATLLFITWKIHKRHPRTLINARENIRFRRAIAGFTVWILIRFFSSLLFSILYSENYFLNDISRQSFLILFLGLILCLSASILIYISISYILQGMNRVVESQFILIFCVSFLAVFILIFLGQEFNLFYFLMGIINALFWIFLILKDEGIELNIGWLTATAFYFIFCVRSNISDLPELFSQCPALVVAGPVPEMIRYPISIAQIAIFYYLFFVVRDRNQEGVN